MHREENYSKEKYVIAHAWPVRLLYSYAIAAWLLALVGYGRFLQLDPVYAWVFGPLVAFYTFYQLLSYSIGLHFRPFDLPMHRSFVTDFWKNKTNQPLIDVFLPVCGEPVEVLQKTFQAATHIDYSNKRVYVLDDRGDQTTRQLAESLGCTYLTRENKGHMRKAGNLKHGFDRSTGEFILVFDADFAAHPDIIKELLPYMNDPQTAIVQSPQYFEANDQVHARSVLEFGAGDVQEDFYRVIQKSRDSFGAAICVGSNALYRRRALDTIGGPYQIEHSEDVHTGFHLLRKGWKLKYIPLILAIGLCPDNMHSFFHQQHRWCSGSMSLLVSKEFWTAPLPWMTKLCFVSGFCYYLSHAVQLVMGLQLFVLLFWHFEKISLIQAAWFLPAVLYAVLVLPLFRTQVPKYGTFLAKIAYSRSYLHALFTKLTGGVLGWQPTGTTRIGISRAYRNTLLFSAGYLLFYMGCLAYAIHLRHFTMTSINYISVNFWILFFLVSHALYLAHGYEVVDTEYRVYLRNRVAATARLWGMRFGTVGVFSIAFVALPIAGYLNRVPVSIAAPVKNIATPVVTPANSAVPIHAVSPTPTVTSTLSVIPNKGEGTRPSDSSVLSGVIAGDGSVYLTLRRLIGEYNAAHGHTLLRWQRVSIETTLAQLYKGQPITKGQTITITSEEMQATIDALSTMTPSQVRQWDAYARTVVLP